MLVIARCSDFNLSNINKLDINNGVENTGEIATIEKSQLNEDPALEKKLNCEKTVSNCNDMRNQFIETN